ncbi:MAG TPA: hypothetical protein VGM84_19685 [Steroidobacteraceae bacterium]|jgi:glucan phosphoethanolaminetransferase (alkaline phosphatase superfamily)
MPPRRAQALTVANISFLVLHIAAFLGVALTWAARTSIVLSIGFTCAPIVACLATWYSWKPVSKPGLLFINSLILGFYVVFWSFFLIVAFRGPIPPVATQTNNPVYLR